MKILLVGNSQLACLKKAHDLDGTILGKIRDVHFFVTPGGTGPYLEISDDLLLRVKKGGLNPKFPPREYPDGVSKIPIIDYGAIVVSALGYLDGGYYYPNSITRQGVLNEFGPKPNQISNRPLSKSCYRRVIESSLLSQPGFLFLRELRERYRGKIIVQPFPLLSSSIAIHPNWPLNQMYESPREAHIFFSSSRDDFMEKLSKSHSFDLLAYPSDEWKQNCFTPSEFIGSPDGLHPDEKYGMLVIKQIARLLGTDRK